ncbi:hypothetical protein BBOV_III001180 [Babesia bovis T2Bo]|uniref:Microprotein domain-containing protein n=1 Tax=Babesia bovis TaxID=5865 RepID=A7AMA1_BABBO|nr:hypothetical protein BBOV_III001180 [Babesia bovis T2Bo]EDO07685.1 hypothetical protein BBOV_III001180 [Babesia bovis T2Bo]|eukprot:XP_001611253.1 hypothetical protein [Babesia bovis T2Bo]
MELNHNCRRVNGFGKVTKWVAGLAVVTYSAAGNVICCTSPGTAILQDTGNGPTTGLEQHQPLVFPVRHDDVQSSDFQSDDNAPMPLRSPNHRRHKPKPVTVYRKKLDTLNGETYEKDIAAIDFTTISKEDGNRMKMLIRQKHMGLRFGDIPYDIAKELVKYDDIAKVPQKMRSELIKCMVKHRTDDLIYKFPESIASMIFLCRKCGDLPGNIASRLKQPLTKHEFGMLLDELPENLASEVSKFAKYEDIPRDLVNRLQSHMRKERFLNQLSCLPKVLARRIYSYGSIDAIPTKLREAVNKYLDIQHFDDLVANLPKELSDEVKRCGSFDRIHDELKHKIRDHYSKHCFDGTEVKHHKRLSKKRTSTRPQSDPE